MQDERLQGLAEWTKQVLQGHEKMDFTPIIGDASFRRYFRFKHQGRSLIAMDAPPTLEDSHPFVAIARGFASLGVRVPTVYAANLEQGFLLLEDLGAKLYLQELSESNADTLYDRALETLMQIHACQNIEEWNFPPFDAAFMMRELTAFQSWFLEQYLQIKLPAKILKSTFEILIQSAEEQPQVCVHRDYHSRNLMVMEANTVGILDFQDAVWGPITYDAVSLLRDCYIAWPSEKVQSWALQFYARCKAAGFLTTESEDQFIRWFDLMGIQRHLKAIFIFSRKYLRDGVSIYLGDIPRVLNYILEVSEKYPELSPFREQLVTKVLPRFEEIAA